MVKTTPKLQVTWTLTLELNEAEAQALDAIVGYGDDEFLKVFYQHMGKAYLAPYEDGFRSLSKAIREQLQPQLYTLKEQRKALAEGLIKSAGREPTAGNRQAVEMLLGRRPV
jgi:hypothetical protein